MFKKKKERKQQPDNPFGIDLMQDFDPNNMGDDDDDDELEAELHRLTTGGDIIARQPRRPAPKPPVKPINLDIVNTDEPSDEELSGDDDDPVLLNELHSILGEESEEPEEQVQPDDSPTTNDTSNNTNTEETMKLLEERLVMYKNAVDKAKNANESSKARRYGRGIKTLEGMLKDTKAGKNVDSASIPPPLVQPPTISNDDAADTALSEDAPAEIPQTPVEESPIDISEPPPLEPELEPTPAPVIDQEKLDLLKKRQHEYKIAALTWKKSGNQSEAVNLLKIAKQFDVVIAALNSGNPIDLSDMPPSPQLPQTIAVNDSHVPEEKEESQIQVSTDEEPTPVATITGVEEIAAALKERLEVYRRTKVAAEEEGNSSKARRYGRICKQYEDAIKLQARGKPIPVAELPIPPGFPPIVVDPQPAAAPVPQRPKAPVPPNQTAEDNKPSPPPRTQKRPPGTTLSRAEKQTLYLQRRQAEFKRAALTAKKDGDIELARDYLRQAKGLDPLIEASMGGLPVDLTSIPLSPEEKVHLSDGKIDAQSTDSFALVSSDDCQPTDITGSDQEIYDRLEEQLIKQNKVCLATRDHAKALGDVAGYNRWERMAVGYARDLDMLRVRKRDGRAPPQHHYEEKTYAIVKSCTDLTDSDLEISIIRGINYPKDADTYVIYEFPYPSDNPPSERTSTIRGTSTPEYDATFMLAGNVDRSSRQCQRAFKRHALKCQVWSKGGFFRSDSLLGTVTIKLQPLETQCVLHDSFPLMNGRKATGGKLEVKLRLRNPMATKQIEKMTDKWLIIDN